MLSWDETFMQMASVIARRSKDPDTQVGAVVVDGSLAVVSTGFNGPPRRGDDSTVPMTRPEKYDWMIHAEHNAILFAIAALGSYHLASCTLYSTGLICARCALITGHVGVKRVVCGPQRPACSDEVLTRKILAHCDVTLEVLP